jgi:hypothetical protein
VPCAQEDGSSFAGRSGPNHLSVGTETDVVRDGHVVIGFKTSFVSKTLSDCRQAGLQVGAEHIVEPCHAPTVVEAARRRAAEADEHHGADRIRVAV